MSVLSHGKESAEPEDDENLRTTIPLYERFQDVFDEATDATVEGIYGKSIELLGKNNAVVPGPGYDKKAWMVESRKYILSRQGRKKENIRVRKTFPDLSGIGHYRHVRGLGKSMVVFRLFEKLRYSNKRSAIFLESLPRIEVFGGGK